MYIPGKFWLGGEQQLLGIHLTSVLASHSHNPSGVSQHVVSWVDTCIRITHDAYLKMQNSRPLPRPTKSGVLGPGPRAQEFASSQALHI